MKSSFQNIPTWKILQVSLNKNIWEKAKKALELQSKVGRSGAYSLVQWINLRLFIPSQSYHSDVECVDLVKFTLQVQVGLKNSYISLFLL